MKYIRCKSIFFLFQNISRILVCSIKLIHNIFDKIHRLTERNVFLTADWFRGRAWFCLCKLSNGIPERILTYARRISSFYLLGWMWREILCRFVSSWSSLCADFIGESRHSDDFVLSIEQFPLSATVSKVTRSIKNAEESVQNRTFHLAHWDQNSFSFSITSAIRSNSNVLETSLNDKRELQRFILNHR